VEPRVYYGEYTGRYLRIKFPSLVPNSYTLFEYVLHPSMTTFDATTTSIPPSEAPRAPTLTVNTLVSHSSQQEGGGPSKYDDGLDLDAQPDELKESLNKLSQRSPHDAWLAISVATTRRSDAIKAAKRAVNLSPGNNAENERTQAGQSPPEGK
jgi:hypothetical protein